MNRKTPSVKSNILSYLTLLSIYIFTALSLSAPVSLAQQSLAAGSNACEHRITPVQRDFSTADRSSIKARSHCKQVNDR